MGQKVHPIGFRLGITNDWSSRWYAEGDFAEILYQDIEIRSYVEKVLKDASISGVDIDRLAKNTVKVTLHTARPGVIIGKKGEDIEALRAKLGRMLDMPVHIAIEEVRKPELDAKLVADNIASQLERRIMFRRAMKRAVTSAMRAGAEGIKICLSGRLGGAEIARSEWYREGRVPLHTLRANIDYGTSESNTTYGVIGVKVWIFKGEVLAEKKQQPIASEVVETESEA
ncbi:MAG: 30S ribosomal protein S3 [Gammaproteobacteria bacterium]